MTTSRRRIPINNHAFANHAATGSASSYAHASKPQVPEATSSGATGPAFPGNGPDVAPGPTGAEATEPQMQRSHSKGPHAPDPRLAELQAAETLLIEAQAELDKVTEERDALTESVLRLRAEFENYRKRATRELVQARDRAQGELLSELLPVLDNLERALEAAEHHEEGKVLGGVRMTRDMFADLLRRSGVEEIETVGVRFDPVVHEAMLLQPSDSDEGIVTAVLERGYRQGEHVLRPARVAVSSGPGAPVGSGTAG